MCPLQSSFPCPYWQHWSALQSPLTLVANAHVCHPLLSENVLRHSQSRQHQLGWLANYISLQGHGGEALRSDQGSAGDQRTVEERTYMHCSDHMYTPSPFLSDHFHPSYRIKMYQYTPVHIFLLIRPLLLCCECRIVLTLWWIDLYFSSLIRPIAHCLLDHDTLVTSSLLSLCTIGWFRSISPTQLMSADPWIM
jgi:hypothetical protein